jgi:hypothetical protein
MERLRNLIKEALSTPLKKDKCNCGCHDCDNVGNAGVVLNESVAPKEILSENLRYHVVNKLPLTENTFRYGSESFLNLWAEARALYLREIIHVNDDDKEILEETDLGNYGIYEGVKVPLDLEEAQMLDGYEVDFFCLKTKNLKKLKVKRKTHQLENQNVVDLKNSTFTLENLEEELKKYLLEIQLDYQLK